MGRLLRTIWICLLVLGLPLQGLAAVTMALCGPAPGTLTAAKAPEAQPCHAEATAHEPDQATPAPDATAAAHTCSHCSTCSFVAALPQTLVTLPTPHPVAEVFEPVVAHVADFAVAGPERPPRSARA